MICHRPDYGLSGRDGCVVEGWQAGPLPTEPVDLAEMAEALPLRFVPSRIGGYFNGVQYVRRCAGCGEEFPVDSHLPGYLEYCSQTCLERDQ